MTGQLDLFADAPRCVLPGCDATVDAVGQPCDDCLSLTTAVGPLLRPVTDRAPMTAEAIAARDAGVYDAYRAQRAIAAAAATGETVEQPAAERRANQRCWLCEERRTCTRAPAGWECADCAAIV